MGRRKKIRWTSDRPLDSSYHLIGDEPETYPGRPVCPECGFPMAYYDVYPDDYFECDDCDIRISGYDAMNGSWDQRQHPDEKPLKCIGCSGNYPECRERCTLINH